MTGETPHGSPLMPASVHSPEVSIVIPVHNREHLLGRALATVQAQVACPSYEVIVVDDASTDRSAHIAEEHGARVLRLELNKGPGGARNKGIAVAQAPWIAFLDSDDLWGPHHLATLWAAREGMALVATSGLTVSATGTRIVGSPFVHTVNARRPADILRPENIINTSAVLVRADVVRELGGFELTHSEDLDLWLRILRHHRGRILARITLVNISHGGQISASEAANMVVGRRDALRFAEADAAISPAARRRLESVAAWDELRAHRTAWPIGTLLRRGPRLAPLLARRFVSRHRWRLPGSGLDEIKELLREHDRGRTGRSHVSVPRSDLHRP